MRDSNGILIVIEGVDGVGKTTALHSTYNQLLSLGYDVVKTSESAVEVNGIDNRFSSTLVNLVKESFTQEQADPTTQALMIGAARRAHYQNVLAPLLKAGKIVLMDRFYLSTFFNYQAGCPVNGQVYSLAMGNFRPDYTVVLRADAATARSRINARAGVTDMTDASALQRFAEIQNNLLRYVTNNPGFVIDATQEREVVAESLTDQILYAIDEIRDGRKK